MFDVNTAADVPEAGALGPLPTGADVGGALSLSAGLFATALAARSKGDMETPTYTLNGETDKGTVPAGTAGLAVPTPDDVTESTATLLGLGRLVSPDVDPLQVADLVSSPEESKAAGFDPVEADGGAEPGRQTWAVPPAGTPAAAVEGASVDSAEASSTATAAARSAMSADGAGPVEPGLVEPGTLGQTVHGQHVQRPEKVPPGLANGRRSPATVAESGGGTVVVPPAAPDIRLSSSDTGPGPSPVPVHVSAGGSAQSGPGPSPAPAHVSAGGSAQSGPGPSPAPAHVSAGGSAQSGPGPSPAPAHVSAGGSAQLGPGPSPAPVDVSGGGSAQPGPVHAPDTGNVQTADRPGLARPVALSVPHETLPSLAGVPGRPAGLDPVTQTSEMAVLREQVGLLAHRPLGSVPTSNDESDGAARERSSETSQAAVQLAQAVKRAILAEGDDAVAKLLRAVVPSGDTQHRVISNGLTQAIKVDVAAADGEQSHTPLPQFGFVEMAEGEVEGQTTRGTGQMPAAFDPARAEARRYEEVTRLFEQGQIREVTPMGLAGRVSDITHDLAMTTKGVTSTTQYADLAEYELPDQVVRAIRMQWRDGVSEARIRLNPPQLGEVQVALQVRNGLVSAVLSADSDVVRGWIRSQQHELKAMLEAQGLELEQLVVEEERHSRQQPDRSLDHPERRVQRRPQTEARFEVRV